MLRVLLSICWIIKQLSCSISRNIAKTGEYPRIFPCFQNDARCEKDLKNDKDNYLHLVRKYARIFVCEHYLFLVAHSFPRASLSENCSLLGTDNVRGQISKHIFAPNGDCCLYNARPGLYLLKRLPRAFWFIIVIVDMFTDKTLNGLGFGITTIFHCLEFNCICWLGPAATDSPGFVFIRSSSVGN